MEIKWRSCAIKRSARILAERGKTGNEVAGLLDRFSGSFLLLRTVAIMALGGEDLERRPRHSVAVDLAFSDYERPFGR